MSEPGPYSEKLYSSEKEAMKAFKKLFEIPVDREVLNERKKILASYPVTPERLMCFVAGNSDFKVIKLLLQDKSVTEKPQTFQREILLAFENEVKKGNKENAEYIVNTFKSLFSFDHIKNALHIAARKDYFDIFNMFVMSKENAQDVLNSILPDKKVQANPRVFLQLLQVRKEIEAQDSIDEIKGNALVQFAKKADKASIKRLLNEGKIPQRSMDKAVKKAEKRDYDSTAQLIRKFDEQKNTKLKP